MQGWGEARPQAEIWRVSDKDTEFQVFLIWTILNRIHSLQALRDGFKFIVVLLYSFLWPCLVQICVLQIQSIIERSNLQIICTICSYWVDKACNKTSAVMLHVTGEYHTMDCSWLLCETKQVKFLYHSINQTVHF